MESERILRVLRQQAWQRAKGELQAVLVTYWGEKTTFEAIDKLIADFTEAVDEGALAE